MAQITESDSASVHADVLANGQPCTAEENAGVTESSVTVAQVLPEPAEMFPPSQTENDSRADSTGTSCADIAPPVPVQQALQETHGEAQSQIPSEQVPAVRDEVLTTHSAVAADAVSAAAVSNQLLSTLLAVAERVLSSQPQNATPAVAAVNAGSRAVNQGDQEDFLRAVAADIHDKQYRLYGWCDAKTQALVTTNAALFAAVGFLYAQCLNDFLAMVLLGIGAFFLGASLITCLVHVIPRISSGQTGKDPNTRSLRGIGLYATWEEYRDAFTSATKTSFLTDTIRSIYGMVRNNLRSYRIIRRGVSFTLVGVVAIVAAMVTSAFAVRGHHAFGSWKTESISTSGGAGVAQPTSAHVPSGGATPIVPPAVPVSASIPSTSSNTQKTTGAKQTVAPSSTPSTDRKQQ